MSQFVNYNKRSITLPGGCKNLIDVLQHQELGDGVKPPDLSKAIARGGGARGKLSDLPKYVKMAFSSRALTFTLVVSPPSARLTLEVAKMQGSGPRASVLVTQGTTEETTVRSFFATHSLQLPEDSPSPKHFTPEVPMQLICRILPMPGHPDALSTLASDLFRQVCGFSDESVLTFCHDELVNIG